MRRDLQERFKNEQDRLSAFREEAERKAVRWVFATEEIWSYHDLKLRQFDRGILPGPEGARFAFGFDSENRPIAVRHFRWELGLVPSVPGDPHSKPRTDELPTKDIVVEEFLRYEGNRMDVTRFLREKLQSVGRIHLQNGWIYEDEAFQDGYYARTRFLYEGTRKKAAQSLNEDGRVVNELVYDEHGQATCFRVRRDGARVELARPLPKGTTLKSLLAKIERRLIQLIPEKFAGTKIGQPIYCVALAYDAEGNDVLPPVIGAATDAERQAWIAQHGKDAWQYVWNPAEFGELDKTQLQLDDDELEEACDLVNTTLANRDSKKPAMDMLVRVARDLSHSDWPAGVPRTPDFVVYAVDFEVAHLQKNLKAVLTPEKLKDAKKRGYL